MIDKVNTVADGGKGLNDRVLPPHGNDHISLLETRAQEETIKRQYPRQLITVCRHQDDRIMHLNVVFNKYVIVGLKSGPIEVYN